MVVIASHSKSARCVAALLAAASLATVVGCGGGGMSASEMRKYAIKRTPDPEVESESPSAAPKPATKASPTPEPANVESPETTAAEASHKDVDPVEEVPGVVESTPPAATTDQAGLSDTLEPPAEPLSPAERLRMAGKNIERIAVGLEAYRESRNIYPGSAMTDRAGTPLLSWRVSLLPYLGYKKLYAQFRLDEPWNSPSNRKLVELIPSVYQSPERFDSTTNYLAPIASNTALGKPRGMHPRRMDDGPEHTAFVIEVDDGLAVPWTKPVDFDYDSRKQLAQVAGTLRNGYVLVAWGGGYSGAVSLSESDQALRAMFTVDGGEVFSSYSVSMPIDEAAVAKITGGGNRVSAGSAPQPTATGSVAATSGPAGANQSAPPAASTPVVAAPAESLAADYRDAAHAAWTLGRAGDALRWLYAADIVNFRAPAGLSFAWYPALRRPCSALHIGVGVRSDFTLLLAGPQERNNRRRDNLRDRTRQAIGAPGNEWLEAIEEHAAACQTKALPAAPADDRQRADEAPRSITFLGAGSRTEVTRIASENVVDVLVWFEPGASSSRGDRTVSCEVYDLIRGERLAALPRIAWTDDAAGLRSLGRDDDFRESKWQLDDFLADKLTPQPLPESLRSKHAVARVQALAGIKTINPLQALSEMIAYRRLGLIGDRDLLDGMRNLLGDDEGETLMLGTDSRRHRLLRRWLPAGDPEEWRQLAESTQRRRRANDEDD